MDNDTDELNVVCIIQGKGSMETFWLLSSQYPLRGGHVKVNNPVSIG